jgi:uncharacterized protein
MSTVLVNGDGAVVCAECAFAATIRTRLKGLLGRSSLEPGEGLLLRPANSVHTAFMRFAIDVVFLDRELRVIDVAGNLRPWRTAGRRGARAVLELPSGEAARRELAPGVQLRLEEKGVRR